MIFTIRPATANDFEACCMLLDQIDTLHRENLPKLYRRSPETDVRDHDYWMGLVANDRAGVLVAERAETLVGLVQVKLQETPPVPILVPRRFAFVDTLAVDHRYRRKGVASQLMRAAEEWAIERQAEYMELTVLEFNKGAIAFYQELRYETLNQEWGRRLHDKTRANTRLERTAEKRGRSAASR